MGTFRYSLLLAAVAAYSQSAPDFFSTKSIGELAVSPDGRTALFTVSTADLIANRTVSRLMRIPTKGGEPQAVAGALEGASGVRWAPDGSRFAYIAKNAIWVQSLQSPKPVRVCAYDHSNSFLSKAGNMLSWSPDGTQLAFAGTTERRPPEPDPVVVTRIQYKTRTALSDNRRTHIYIVPARGGAPRAVTSGRFDEHSIDWGGDGREIIFVSNHETDPDARLNYDIFAVNIASGSIRQITRTPGVEEAPKLSPDDRSIAYTATTRPLTTIDSVAEDTHVWVVPASGGEGQELNRALDRRSFATAWTADSTRVLFTAADHGKMILFEVPASGGESKALVDKKAQVIALSAAGGTVAFTMSDAAHPAEVYTLQGQLTHLNNIEGWNLSVPETIAYKSFDGADVEEWLYPPTHPAGHIPMILSIHGGPHGQFGYAFNPAAQFYASRGYATLTINPRGSSGYGQKFADGTIGNWGGGDYKDLMAGVDHVLQNHRDIDPERLGVTGGSYGGYMTNWVITQTHRFKAAVAAASVSDLVSFYATSLYQDLIHAEFSGYPWSGGNYALLWKWSPLAYVKDATTPTMFLHGERDNDVHITQAEEMYTALRQRGVEAELVRYPREGHGFREPKHQKDSRERTMEWMDRFLQVTH